MDNKLFRQEAIDRIESPERLNEMIKITSSRDWIMLYVMVCLFVAILFWAIFGQLPSYVNGQGILLQLGGVNEVSAISQGRITKTPLEEGVNVMENDIIAFVDQPELQLHIDNEVSKLNDVKSSFSKIKNFGSENLNKKSILYEKERLITIKSIEINDDRLEFIKERISAQEELLSKGLITKETLNTTKNNYYNVQQENEALKNDLKRINLLVFQSSEENEINLQKLRSEILLIENKILELKSLFLLNTVIKSPCNGKIIELMVKPGTVIYPGSPIARIEPYEIEEKVQAIIYVNPRDGKKIKVGMNVKISPSTVAVEEYGYISGIVEKVSEYPATHDGMLKTLGNNELVKSFSNTEPPIAITVRLEKDSTTFSGYKWTSIMGPSIEIRTGTLCTSKVVVETKRPISLLIPPKLVAPVINIERKLVNRLTVSKLNDTILSEIIQPFDDSVNLKVIKEVDNRTVKETSYYTIQILATKHPVDANKLRGIYTGSETIHSRKVNDMHKYYVGKFPTKNLAIKFKGENNMLNDCFVTRIE